MNVGYRTGKFTAIMVILFLFFVFGLVLADILESSSKKRPGKVASIPAASPTGIFNRTGYIVETSVGRAILYEEPGKPAIRKDLIFNDRSRCDLGNGPSPCLPQDLNSGLRAEVSGFPSGESGVFVSEIKAVR